MHQALAPSFPVADEGRGAFVADVAARVGVSTGALSSAMDEAALDRIDDDLIAGRITSEQAGQLTEAVRQGRLPFGGSVVPALDDG